MGQGLNPPDQEADHNHHPSPFPPRRFARGGDATGRHSPQGQELRPGGAADFDAMFAATPAAADVRTEPTKVGGNPGYWLRPNKARPRAFILYLHGGGYVLGSAQAVSNFASQIAVRVGAATFPNYRLAPEHPFPAAIDDVVAAYRGLVAEGAKRS